MGFVFKSHRHVMYSECAFLTGYCFYVRSRSAHRHMIEVRPTRAGLPLATFKDITIEILIWLTLSDSMGRCFAKSPQVRFAAINRRKGRYSHRRLHPAHSTLRRVCRRHSSTKFHRPLFVRWAGRVFAFRWCQRFPLRCDRGGDLGSGSHAPAWCRVRGRVPGQGRSRLPGVSPESKWCQGSSDFPG